MTNEIKILIQKTVKEVLDEKLRGRGFDIREFKALPNAAEMADYCRDKGLKYLGAGVSRITYLLSSGKAIKIAYNRDVSQNSADAAAFDFFGSDYVPKVYDRDPEYRWLIVELVHTFRNALQFDNTTGGLSDQILGYWEVYLNNNKFNVDIQDFLKWGEGFGRSRQRFIKLQTAITPKGNELLEKYAFLFKKGVSDIDRFEHWGVGADQRIVCVDSGIGG